MSESPAVPLHAYQQRWLRDDSRFKIGMFARQTGKTFTTSLEIVDDCFAAATERAGRRVRWVILSRGERQAHEAMEEGVKRHAAAYGLALEHLDHEFVADDGSRFKALEVGLPGGRITALPANPATARGYSANVFLDEFAWHRESRQIWAALFPVISAGHRIRVTSTPNGKGNKFYELMTADEQIWSQHRVDIYRAVADGLPRDIDEIRAGLGDDELWRQEYELEWLDEASAWLSYDLINGMEHPDAGDSELAGGRSLTVIGNDIGRRRDLWVAWVLQLSGGVAWTRERVELQNKTFRAQDLELDRLVRRWRPGAIWMDQTGMGEKPVEDAIRRYGASRVTGVVFSAPKRLDLATALRTRAQDQTVRIPAGDRQLRADLHSIKRMAGQSGPPRLVVDDDAGESNSHADRFWALALACAALEGRAVEFSYTPVGGAGAEQAARAANPAVWREAEELERRVVELALRANPDADEEELDRMTGWREFAGDARGNWRAH